MITWHLEITITWDHVIDYNQLGGPCTCWDWIAVAISQTFQRVIGDQLAVRPSQSLRRISYIPLSSTNICGVLHIISGRSMIKRTNSMGPRTLPWAIVLSTSSLADRQLFTTTCCLRSIRKDCIQSRTLPLIPYVATLAWSLWCVHNWMPFGNRGTLHRLDHQSWAFENWVHSSKTVSSLVIHDLHRTKPYWASQKNLFSIIWCTRWTLIIDSMRFPIMGVRLNITLPQ